MKFHLRSKKSKRKNCITKLFLYLLNLTNKSKAIISMELVVELLKILILPKEIPLKQIMPTDLKEVHLIRWSQIFNSKTKFTLLKMMKTMCISSIKVKKHFNSLDWLLKILITKIISDVFKLIIQELTQINKILNRSRVKIRIMGVLILRVRIRKIIFRFLSLIKLLLSKEEIECILTQRGLSLDFKSLGEWGISLVISIWNQIVHLTLF
jgi:hypothetical protein